MRYTTDSQGLLNNFAVEPTISITSSPDSKQQVRYIVQGAVATLFVSGLVFTAFIVS